jgi:hypothetical protein
MVVQLGAEMQVLPDDALQHNAAAHGHKDLQTSEVLLQIDWTLCNQMARLMHQASCMPVVRAMQLPASLQLSQLSQRLVWHLAAYRLRRIVCSLE